MGRELTGVLTPTRGLACLFVGRTVVPEMTRIAQDGTVRITQEGAVRTTISFSTGLDALVGTLSISDRQLRSELWQI